MEILDLRHFSSADLRPLLYAESAEWMRALCWDYSGSAEMVLRYMDAKILPGYAAVVNGRVDTPVFTDIGPRETGFPLLVKRTHRSTLKDPEGNIRTFISEDSDEVVEFSEEPLNPDLFIPPEGFRRVARLPGDPVLPFGVRFRVGWQNLKHRFMTR